MMRRAGWLIAFAGVMAWGGTAWSQAPGGTPVRGGTLNFAVVAEPPNYDCHSNTTFGHTHPIAPHYSTLLKFHGSTYPAVSGDLAGAWTSTPDGLSYTFKLHPNIKFHDGTPLTSNDVKVSYERIVRPPEGIALEGIESGPMLAQLGRGEPKALNPLPRINQNDAGIAGGSAPAFG